MLVVGLVAGCAPQTVPPATGTASPVPQAARGSPPPAAATLDPAAWSSADVLQPDVVTQAPSLLPGYHCSPCHPAAASQLFGIAAVPGGFLAVGVQQPPAVAIGIETADGSAWTPVTGWEPGERTTAIATTTNGSRTVVVGSGPGGAAAWVRSGDGWSASSAQDLVGSPGATAMTAVTAWRDGFLAGGYRDDPARGTASAAAWLSDDGLHWRTAAAAGVFAGGRIWGVAARGTVAVAVGTGGDPSYGPAAAWALVGGTWRRATLAVPGGVMRAVTATADGFVAVGLSAADDGARVWRSADGLTWTPVADQPAFHDGPGPVRMQSVAADARGLVAGGWRADAANGSAAAWTSADGEHWAAAPWVPAFSGGQMTGVALAGDRALGTGRSGYPDNNQAAAWVRDRP